MHSLLVTGAAGFIGTNFVYYWKERYPGDCVVVLDALTYAGCRESIAPLETRPGFHFVKGDIRDEALVESLMSEHAVDTVVHFAAESHVDRSISGPDAFVETNVIGTHALLKAARKLWLGQSKPAGSVRFHNVSTDEVYGSLGPSDHPFTESTQYSPNSPYSATKAAADHLTRAYYHTFGLPVTTSNCSNNYGPYQFPEKLIPLIITNALFGISLPVYGDGKNVRDWLFVEDHCRGIELVLQQGRVGQTYNIGGRNEWHNIDIVELVCRLLDEEFAGEPSFGERFPRCPAARGAKCRELITYVTDRLGHDRRYAIDATKMETELGYAHAVQFDQGIRRTIRWYLANEAWWRPLRER